jgi:hypothetical protein
VKQYKRKPNTNCSECKKEIYRRPYQIELGPVFCSLGCSNKRFRKKKKKCLVCEQFFSTTKSNNKTCSRSCSNKSRIGIKYRIGGLKNNASKTARLKQALIGLRGPECEVCKLNETDILVTHHIKERAKGGSDELTNLKLLCPNCHARIHYGKMGELV